MKTLKLLLCTVAVAMAGVSCENAAGTDSSTRTTDRTDTTDVNFPNNEIGGLSNGHAFGLSVSFVDAEGNDLVKGIEGTEPEGSIEANFVAPDQYTLTSSPDYYELGYFSNPTAIYDNPRPYPRLGLMPYRQREWIWDEDYWRSQYPAEEEYNELMERSHDLWVESEKILNGRDWLGLGISTPEEDTKLDTITYTLTCPHIFGDDAPHEIITYWKDPATGPNYFSVCYRIVVDGIEFTDIVRSKSDESSFATIVLDR